MLIASIIHSDPDSDINYRLGMTTDGSTELSGKGTNALREEATQLTPERCPDSER